MTIRVGAALLVISMLGFSYWYSPAVWISITACMIPALIIAIAHGERINILSGRRLGMMNATKGNSLALVGAFFVPGRVTEVLKPLYYYKTRQLPISVGVSVLIV